MDELQDTDAGLERQGVLRAGGKNQKEGIDLGFTLVYFSFYLRGVKFINEQKVTFCYKKERE
jgi:hypothetical protein